jgi:uncharacterized protein involved in response to NO
MTACAIRTPAPALLQVLGDEGLRLFFPLAAVHAALWPFLWAAVLGFQLPFAGSLPPGLWHASEMIFGSYGAALISFITTAMPEWTDTARPRGRALLVLAGLVFLGLLGLVLARIAVPVTNLVLDPGEATSPYRPHPGRRNLAPGLVALAIAGTLAGWSPAVTACLTIAAGAAFLDRVAEAFIGREAFRAEILALAGSSLLAGAGLLLAGAARLGAPFAETPALHLALMGGLGLGVLAMFAIAGLFHTGRALPLPRAARAAFALLVLAVLARVLPDLGFAPDPPGPPHALASVLWAAAFLVWLRAYWPYLSLGRQADGCGGAETG